MWKRVPNLADEKQYTLNLCQSPEGRRYCAVTEAGHSTPDMIRRTVEIPADLIRRYDTREIERFPLTDGSFFVFGPHGEWFTAAEADALSDDHELVPWVTSLPPALPPK